MYGGYTRFSGVFASISLCSLVCGRPLSFAMVHRFMRCGKVMKLLLFSKPKSMLLLFCLLLDGIDVCRSALTFWADGLDKCKVLLFSSYDEM